MEYPRLKLAGDKHLARCPLVKNKVQQEIQGSCSHHMKPLNIMYYCISPWLFKTCSSLWKKSLRIFFNRNNSTENQMSFRNATMEPSWYWTKIGQSGLTHVSVFSTLNMIQLPMNAILYFAYVYTSQYADKTVREIDLSK